MSRVLALHLGVLAGLFALHFVLPAYHHGNLARVMVLAVYATGYNLAFGYTGLLSLGHALFFAAGLYGAGSVARMRAAPRCRRCWPARVPAAGWRWRRVFSRCAPPAPPS